MKGLKSEQEPLNGVEGIVCARNRTAGRRAYQIGMRLHPQATTKSEPSLFRKIFVDYGSFLGAVVGALITLLAGAAAWYGVQGQINLQNTANNIALSSYLRSELEKLYARHKALLQIDENTSRNLLYIMAIGTYSIWPRTPDGQFNPKIISTFYSYSLLPDEQSIELAKGVAGSTGLLYFEFELAIKKIKHSYKEKEDYSKSDHDKLNKEITDRMYIGQIEEYKKYIKDTIVFLDRVQKDLVETRSEVDHLENKITSLNLIVGK